MAPTQADPLASSSSTNAELEHRAPAGSALPLPPLPPQLTCRAGLAVFEAVHRWKALAKPRKVSSTSEVEAAAHRSLSQTGRHSVSSLEGTDSLDDAKATVEELSSVSSPPLSEDSSNGWSSDLKSLGSSSTYSSDFLGSQDSIPNLQREVICRLEFVTARETRAAVLFLHVMIAFATAVLTTESVLNKHKVNPLLWFRLNICFATLCAAGLLVCLGLFAARAYAAHKAHRHWTLRRGRMAGIYVAQLVLQVLNLICWLAPNAYALSSECHWFSGIIDWFGCTRWTLWNTIFLTFWVQAHNNLPLKGGTAKGAVVMDAPWSIHWPKLVWWAVFEADLVYLRIRMYLEENAICSPENYGQGKTTPHWLIISTYLIGAGVLGYTIAFMYCMCKGARELKKQPYSEFRTNNLAHQILMRTTMSTVNFMVLSTFLLWYLNPRSIDSYYFTWFGLAPVQIAMTSLAVQGAFWFMPNAKDFHKHDPILQVWLQQFAWTEDTKAEKLAERQSYGNNTDILQEPMFCLETAIKSLYWAQLVYGFQEAPVPDSAASAETPTATDATLLKTKWKPMEDCTIQGEVAQASGMGESYSLEFAMSLYHLQHAQLFWEQSLDTKVLVAWSRHMILLAFRGTASFTNALADMKAWRQVHPPKRGRLLLGTQPLVHAGFQNSWRANGLHDKILEHICSLIQAHEMDISTVRVMVTGHSLGGALATLAAIDLQREFSFPHGNLQCYTFGAPRTGNHAFAKEYNALVPDTWHLINDMDVVPRGAKFITLYKRPGHRVLMNRKGDLVVRPSPLELRLQFNFGKLSGKGIKHHLLASYIESIIQACRVQFTRKRVKGGLRGVQHLLADKRIYSFLKTAGFSDYKELLHDARWMHTLEKSCNKQCKASKVLGVIREFREPRIDPEAVREFHVQIAMEEAEAECCGDSSHQLEEVNAESGGDVEVGKF